MKIRWVIDKSMDEEVLEIHAVRKHAEIEEWCSRKQERLIGYHQGFKIWIQFDKVYAVMTENHAVVIKSKNENYQSRQRLYEIEEILNEKFVRISQSEIINMDKIRCFHKTGIRNITIELENGLLCNISRRYVSDVRRRLEERQ